MFNLTRAKGCLTWEILLEIYSSPMILDQRIQQSLIIVAQHCMGDIDTSSLLCRHLEGKRLGQNRRRRDEEMLLDTNFKPDMLILLPYIHNDSAFLISNCIQVACIVL